MSVSIVHRLQTYVAECVGVHAVGYTIMIYGLGTSLGSVAGGKLLALEAKFQVVLAALTLHLTILLFLIIWEREPLLPILLTIPFLCGICDGTWMTVCSSKYNVHNVSHAIIGLRKKIHPSWRKTECGPDWILGDLQFESWGWRDFFPYFGLFSVTPYQSLSQVIKSKSLKLGNPIRLQHTLLSDLQCWSL